MQIHVVQPGQTLTEIAQAYSVPVDQLIASNEIANPDALVPGQTIVIPIWGSYYWLAPGETLSQVAARFGMEVWELARINGIQDINLIPAGLRLYIPQRQRVEAEIFTFIEPTGSAADREAILEFGDQITYLGMFPYTFDRAGNLGVIDDRIAREAAAEKNIATIMVVTNLEAGDFSTDLGGALLSDPALQERLLDQIIEVASARGFRGVNFDFERLPEDAAGAYNAFLRRAAARFAERNLLLSTDLVPKVSPYQAGIWYAAHDYQTQGNLVDWATLMTYDWGWPGGPPEPVAPLPEVQQVLQYAVSTMPRETISMGIPLYGYDWILPFAPGNPPARAWTLGQIINLALRHQVPIQYDVNAQSPFIRYRDEQGRDHIVWFEDARSIQAKLEQVRNFGLRGASLWRLPFSAAQAWLLIDDNFLVRKVG